jgi:hypothetical protein
MSFSQAQVPDIIRQLMVWKAAWHADLLYVAISPRVHPVIPQGAEMA